MPRLIGLLLLLVQFGFAATGSDTFTGTGSGLGANWTATRGGMDRNSGIAEYASGSPAVLYWNGFTPGNAQQSEMTLGRNADDVFDGTACVDLYLTDTDQYWYRLCTLGRGDVSWSVRDPNGDRINVHTWTLPYSFLAGQTIRARTDGSGHFYIDTNGVLADTWTDAAEAYTGGRVGIGAVGGGVIQGIDSWTGGDVSSAPVITVDPSNATVTAPATANFNVTATGSSLTYQWQKNGVNVSTGTGGTTNSYTTGATSGSDDGAAFRCIVSNGFGADTSAAATLTVHLIPTVTVDPADATKVVGQTATFTTTATGTATLVYQWQRNGVNVCTGGTSSSYTTPTLTPTYNGSLYRCVITNSYGADTSAAATLHIASASAGSHHIGIRRRTGIGL